VRTDASSGVPPAGRAERFVAGSQIIWLYLFRYTYFYILTYVYYTVHILLDIRQANIVGTDVNQIKLSSITISYLRIHIIPHSNHFPRGLYIKNVPVFYFFRI
jgi:hypothetical protein